VIWNDELLFLHPQKTAGMAITDHLVNLLRTPVFISTPLGHGDSILRPGIAHVLGHRHENLFEAAAILEPFNRTLSDFKAILVPMRNPYDMEVSRYYHLRKPQAFEQDEDRKLALTGTFEEFIVRSEFRSPHPDNQELEFREAIKNYYSMGATFLENLRVLRYECIETDLNEQLAQFGYEHISLREVNVSEERSERDFRRMVLSKEVEQAVYAKYRWIFEHGFYSRLSV